MITIRTALRIPGFDIAILGYALFLVINACSLWGGVFPFFPHEFHGEEVTFAFMLAQSMASLLTYIVILVCSFKVPSIVTKSLHGVSSFPAFLGGALLIAALYLPEWRVALVTVAGCCMGAGGTLLSLVWARYFSAENTDRGNFFILTGTFCAPLLFALLYLVPQAVRVFLIPLIFVPLCGLSVLLSFRKLNKDLPIFQDDPRTNVPVYVRIVRVYWKSAFAIGTMGFASGLVRSIAVADVQLGDVTNAASFLGLFIIAGLMLLLWQRRSFALNLHFVFMVSFPLVAVCLAFFPFVEGKALAFISGVVFLLFSLANIIVMLQSAHICLNRGCNPFFVYGFFGSIVGLLQNGGFIFGHLAMANRLFGEQTPFAVAVIGLLVLTITLYAFVGRSERFTSKLPQYDNVEFISFGMKPGQHGRMMAYLMAPAAPAEQELDSSVFADETINLSKGEYQVIAESAASPVAGSGGSGASGNSAKGSEAAGEARAANAASRPANARADAANGANVPTAANAAAGTSAGSGTDARAGAGTGASSGADASAGNKRRAKSAEAETRRAARNPFPDDLYHSTEKGPSRITLRCKILQEEYRLTSRETEIMELIVRGYSVARIAEEHVVSENTVRTHYKHIYAKLGIHKKQELIAMVDALKDTI